MATVFNYATSANRPGQLNGRGIVFNRPMDRKRVKIKLGRVTNATASDVKRRVEALTRCRRVGGEASPNVVEWLTDIADDLHAKLAGHGLTDARVEAVQVPTVAAWCDSYIGERTDDLKPGSVKELRRTADLLRDYFGGDTSIGDIGETGARDWRAWLRSRPVGKPEDKRRMTEATTRKQVRNAKAMWAAAGKVGLIPGNPFSVLSGATIAARRDRHISTDEAEAIIEAMPDGAYRLIFALARFGGLRVPSESHELTWGDIDWDRGRMRVRSVKTERFSQHAERTVPIHPRLRVLLMDAFETASEGQEQVVRVSRNNLRRIGVASVRRAAIEPIPGLYQTARQSCETDWAARFPQHAVSKWLGHSVAVSVQHYLGCPDDLYATAAGMGGESKGTEKGTELTRMDAHGGEAVESANIVTQTKRLENKGFLANSAMRRAGLEPTTVGLEIRCSIQLSYRRNSFLPPINPCSASGYGGSAEYRRPLTDKGA